MSKPKENNYICGTCKNFDPDINYCPLQGTVYEQDTCDEWADDNEPTENFTMEMLCCEATILNEISHKECKRNDIALTYYFCMVSSEDIDYAKVNKAIIERWSFSGLEYIKKEAYKWAEKRFKAREIGG